MSDICNYEKMYKRLISRLQWHDIEKEQPVPGTTVEIRVLYTRDELENKKDLTYETAFHINYYYGIYGEYGENGRNFLSSYYEKHLRKSNKYLTIDKGYNEWSRYFSGRGDKLDFRGDYILWEDTVKVPDNRKIEWRYLVEEDGEETLYTPAI